MTIIKKDAYMEYKLDNAVGYLINVTAGKFKNKIYQVLSSYDITPEQWIVLTRLWEGDGKTQRQLAEETFKDQPNIARILRKMEYKGYIERGHDDKDRRITLVFITQKGIQLSKQLLPLVSEYQQQMLENLSADEISTLKALLRKI
jgi:DNA-binding MarR family transcriptional regulator